MTSQFSFKLTFFLFLSQLFCLCSIPQDGMYTNPIINKYLADPCILFEQGYYYLFATGRAEDGRYIPIYRSKDLAKWEFVKGAVTRGSKTDWNYKNFWAPEVYKLNNKFYLFYTAMPDTSYQNTGNRVGLAISDKIDGPYTDFGIVVPHASIDGHIFTNTDNKMYIFYTIEHGNRDNLIAGRIYADRMITPEKVEGKPIPILIHHKWQEGPFILHRNDKYYLTYSCGSWGNATYHLRYAVSNSLLGPYTEQPDTLMKSNVVVKGPGHHALFTDSNNKDWIVYHGWDTGFKARYPRIDRLFVTGNGLSTDGPSYTPQSVNK